MSCRCTGDSESRADTLVLGQGMSLITRGTTADIPGRQLAVVPYQIVVGIDFDCQVRGIVFCVHVS
jgi:hypothetical protein